MSRQEAIDSILHSASVVDCEFGVGQDEDFNRAIEALKTLGVSAEEIEATYAWRSREEDRKESERSYEAAWADD